VLDGAFKDLLWKKFLVKVIDALLPAILVGRIAEIINCKYTV
jgi:hypothetical protein